MMGDLTGLMGETDSLVAGETVLQTTVMRHNIMIPVQLRSVSTFTADSVAVDVPGGCGRRPFHVSDR